MALEIRQGEGVAQAVARLEKLELARLGKLLAGRKGGLGPSARSVHEARKSLKRLRSRLLIIRDLEGEARFREAWEKYREAGRLLAGLRDAQVMADAYGQLLKKGEKKGDPAAAVLRRQAVAKPGVEMDKVRVARALLRRIGRLASSRSRGAVSQDQVREVLRRLYRKGWKAARKLEPGAPAEAFHAWRKSAKHLYYLMQMLVPLRPKKLEREVRRLDRLGELLGAGHDLDVLEQVLAAMKADGVPVEPKMAERLRRRRKRLRQKARELGRKVYAAKPAVWKPF